VQVAVRVVPLGAKVLDHDEHRWMSHHVGVRYNPELAIGIDCVQRIEVCKNNIRIPRKRVDDTDHNHSDLEQPLFKGDKPLDLAQFHEVEDDSRYQP
jgi:hypothetical protein